VTGAHIAGIAIRAAIKHVGFVDYGYIVTILIQVISAAQTNNTSSDNNYISHLLVFFVFIKAFAP
jgi:hypothetical protein